MKFGMDHRPLKPWRGCLRNTSLTGPPSGEDSGLYRINLVDDDDLSEIQDECHSRRSKIV